VSSSMHTYATHYGETARVKLPDGSLVTLNANSKLTYQDWEDEKDREVWLEGEAFFEVQKKKRSGGRVKFVVHTDALQVEVLGTRFNVSDRRHRTQVVLEEGKIRLRLTKETDTIIDMKPGELIEYVDSAPLPAKRAVDPHSFVAWKDDQLVLNGKSMRDIAQLITENYGVEVIIQDTATARLKLRGSIPAHNLEELIEALTLAADIKISRKSNTLIFQQP
jgi:transmembrane sensor